MPMTRKLKCWSFFLFCFVFLNACGKFSRIEDGGFTSVNIGSAQARSLLATDTLTYGILIYAYSDSYTTNLKLSSESQLASIVLPNGNYSFYAFGYAIGFGQSGMNSIRCAVASGIALQGGTINVGLNFRESECANGVFSPGASYRDANTSSTLVSSGAIFAGMEYVHCASSIGTGLNSLTSGTQNCGGSPFSAGWAAALRVQAVVPIFKRDAAGNYTELGEAYRSTCDSTAYADPGGNAAISMPVRYPVGITGQNGVFPIRFETFSETACTSAPIGRHEFHKGLIFGPSNGVAGFATALVNPGTSANPNTVRVFLRQP